jgi:hypothetical protein
MLYMISYDLITPGQQYAKLDARITALGGRRVLKSQWLLVNSATADMVWRDLQGYVDSNDRLLVNELTRSAQWGAGKLLISDAEMQQFLSVARC